MADRTTDAEHPAGSERLGGIEQRRVVEHVDLAVRTDGDAADHGEAAGADVTSRVAVGSTRDTGHPGRERRRRRCRPRARLWPGHRPARRCSQFRDRRTAGVCGRGHRDSEKARAGRWSRRRTRPGWRRCRRRRSRRDRGRPPEFRRPRRTRRVAGRINDALDGVLALERDVDVPVGAEGRGHGTRALVDRSAWTIVTVSRNSKWPLPGRPLPGSQRARTTSELGDAPSGMRGHLVAVAAGLGGRGVGRAWAGRPRRDPYRRPEGGRRGRCAAKPVAGRSGCSCGRRRFRSAPSCDRSRRCGRPPMCGRSDRRAIRWKCAGPGRRAFHRQRRGQRPRGRGGRPA